MDIWFNFDPYIPQYIPYVLILFWNIESFFGAEAYLGGDGTQAAFLRGREVSLSSPQLFLDLKPGSLKDTFCPLETWLFPPK